MHDDLFSLLNDDLKVLAARAFEKQTVTAFGLDGNGKYGTSDTPRTYTIAFTVTGVDSGSDPNRPQGWIIFCLEKYDHNEFGHIFTDENLKISLKNLMKAHDIDPMCWNWGDLDDQGGDYFMIKVDVNRVLNW